MPLSFKGCGIICYMEDIRKRLAEGVKRLFDVEVEVEITPAPEETGADYASNVAMKLAKVAHKAPMTIAEELKEVLQSEGIGGFAVEVADFHLIIYH